MNPPSEGLPASDDQVLPFQLDSLGVRGRLVRLGPEKEYLVPPGPERPSDADIGVNVTTGADGSQQEPHDLTVLPGARCAPG